MPLFLTSLVHFGVMYVDDIIYVTYNAQHFIVLSHYLFPCRYFNVYMILGWVAWWFNWSSIVVRLVCVFIVHISTQNMVSKNI